MWVNIVTQYKKIVLAGLGARVGLVVLGGSHVYAAGNTCTWTGTASSNLSDAGNWSGCAGLSPIAGDSLVFPSAGVSNKTVNFNDEGTAYANLTIGDGYVLQGPMELSGKNIDGLMHYVDFTGTGSSIKNDVYLITTTNSCIFFNDSNSMDGISLTGDYDLYLVGASNNAKLTVNGSLDGVGTQNISVASNGSTVTNVSAAFNAESPELSGKIYVNNNATLVATKNTSLGNANGITQVLDGGSLEFDTSASGISTEERLDISGSGVDGSGALRRIGSSWLSLDGDINMSGDATIFSQHMTADSSIFISGVLSGNYSPTFK